MERNNYQMKYRYERCETCGTFKKTRIGENDPCPSDKCRRSMPAPEIITVKSNE